jgi:hypothetical protein
LVDLWIATNRSKEVLKDQSPTLRTHWPFAALATVLSTNTRKSQEKNDG